jgi:hypothetical protein
MRKQKKKDMRQGARNIELKNKDGENQWDEFRDELSERW